MYLFILKVYIVRFVCLQTFYVESDFVYSLSLKYIEYIELVIYVDRWGLVNNGFYFNDFTTLYLLYCLLLVDSMYLPPKSLLL